MSWFKPSRLQQAQLSPASPGHFLGGLGVAAWIIVAWLAGCSSMDDRALSTRGQAAKGGAGTHSNDPNAAGTSARGGGGGSQSQSQSHAGTAAGGDDASEGGSDTGGTAGSAQTGGRETGGTQTGGTQTGGTQSGGTQSGGTQSGGTQSGGTQSGGTQSGGNNNGGRGGEAGNAGNDNGAGGCGDLDGDTVQDCTQTLVENARFDTAVAPWRAESGTQQSWDAKNARPVPGSGALKVSNTSVSQGEGQTLGGSGQCLPADPNKNYLLAARAFIPKGQGQGSAGLSMWFFGADDCADYLLPGAALELVSGTDEWQLVSKSSKAPPATRSIYVRLVTSKPFAQPSLEALFDDVLLREQ
jgi:hypothetical protein